MASFQAGLQRAVPLEGVLASLASVRVDVSVAQGSAPWGERGTVPRPLWSPLPRPRRQVVMGWSGGFTSFLGSRTRRAGDPAPPEAVLMAGGKGGLRGGGPGARWVSRVAGKSTPPQIHDIEERKPRHPPPSGHGAGSPDLPATRGGVHLYQFIYYLQRPVTSSLIHHLTAKNMVGVGPCPCP